jgi:hypothetical protein
MVWTGVMIRSLAVSTGFSAVETADIVAVSGPLTLSSLAVAAISLARKRKRSLPLMTSEPQIVCIRNTYWEF